MFKKINTVAKRLDTYVLELISRRVRPAERRRQIAVLLERLDRKTLAIIAAAVAPERRRQARDIANRAVSAARKSADYVSDRRNPVTAELRQKAIMVGDEIGLIISRANIAVETEIVQPREYDDMNSWIVELSRWRGIMNLEAAGGLGASNRAVRRAADVMGSDAAMDAGDRALMNRVRLAAESRGLNPLDRDIVEVVQNARMTLAKIRHQRGELSVDDLAWELVAARENTRYAFGAVQESVGELAAD